MTTLSLGPDHGRLTVSTGVAGPAARMGHRLELAFDRWHAEVSFVGASPSGLALDIDMGSLSVVSGTGGATPLTPVDKQLIKHNAAKSLRTDLHPRSSFVADSLQQAGELLHVAGTLTIAGAARPLQASLDVAHIGPDTTVTGVIRLRQSDFGVQPYSLMRGALRVADEVEVHVSMTARVPA